MPHRRTTRQSWRSIRFGHHQRTTIPRQTFAHASPPQEATRRMYLGRGICLDENFDNRVSRLPPSLREFGQLRCLGRRSRHRSSCRRRHGVHRRRSRSGRIATIGASSEIQAKAEKATTNAVAVKSSATNAVAVKSSARRAQHSKRSCSCFSAFGLLLRRYRAWTRRRRKTILEGRAKFCS